MCGPPYIQTMHTTGAEGWIVIPLFSVHPMWADTAEMYLIRTKGHSLNAIPTSRRKYMRQLGRSQLYRYLTESALADKHWWTGLIEAKRITLDPTDLVHTITLAERSMQPTFFSMLRRQLLTYIESTMRIQLPTALTLRIPYATQHITYMVRRDWHASLRQVLYPE